MIDVDTAQFRSIPIPDPINRVLVFPSADGPPHRALFATISAAGATGMGTGVGSASGVSRLHRCCCSFQLLLLSPVVVVVIPALHLSSLLLL